MSKNHCRSCSGKHHTLLHENKSQNKAQNVRILGEQENFRVSQSLGEQEGQVVQTESSTTSLTSTEFSGQSLRSPMKGQVLLATARFYLTSDNGKKEEVRGLLDSGSQTSFVTSSIVKLLECKTFDTSLNILGISQTTNKVSKSVKVKVESKVYGDNYDSFSVNCGVLDKITCDLPQQNIESSWFNIPLDAI